MIIALGVLSTTFPTNMVYSSYSQLTDVDGGHKEKLSTALQTRQTTDKSKNPISLHSRSIPHEKENSKYDELSTLETRKLMFRV